MTTDPIAILESAIADRMSKNQRVPQNWFDRLEELRKQNNENADTLPSPFIASVKGEVETLRQRIDKGRAWIATQTDDVRATRTDEQADLGRGFSAPAPELDHWVALTPRGEAILRRWQAISRLHRIGIHLIMADQLITQVEARLFREHPDIDADGELAGLIERMAELQGQWETAKVQLEEAEDG